MYLRGNRRWMPLLCPVEPYNELNASVFLSLACIAGDFLGKRGERGIFKKNVRNVPEARDEGRRKIKALVTSPLLSVALPPTYAHKY